MSRFYSFLLIYSGLHQFSYTWFKEWIPSTWTSLASHSITTFQVKKGKKTLQKPNYWGIFSPGGTTTCPQRNFSGHKESCKYCRWYFDQILERFFLRFDSNVITLNFVNLYFLKTVFDCFFPRKVIMKVRGNWKNAYNKKCKTFKKFFGFSDLC